MATPQTEIESKVLELATESLEAFCEDISGMFGVEMECQEQEISAETVATLKKRFKKLVAVNIVDSKGILDGTFQVILDQEGLFTLGGVMVMLPEKRIMANRKDASADLAESMVDAVGEAGNLLVGAWERIFREDLEGHGHLLQRLPAFVGKPWDKPQEKIGLASEIEHVFIPYEMSIAPYPAFKCGVIFPKTIFESSSSPDSADAAAAEDEAPNQVEANAPDGEAVAEGSESQEPQATAESDAEKVEPAQPAAEEKPAAETPDAEEIPAVETPDDEVANSYTPDDEVAAAETPAVEAPAADDKAANEEEKTSEPEAAEDKAEAEKPAETPQATDGRSEPESPDVSAEQTVAAPEADTSEEMVKDESEAVEPTEEPALGPVSEAIKEMARSSAPPDKSGTSAPAEDATLSDASGLLWIPAKEIMQNQVVWVSPDDSVQQALTQMQQNDLGYLAVGHEGVLEGIISKADVAGAMSPYLRPMFGKWRRPSDDATLQIKLKWIMSRPVRTARPDTPLATILENMCRFGGRVVPVVDEQGKVHGMVTAFDVFQKLLSLGANVPTTGRAPQGPPL